MNNSMTIDDAMLPMLLAVPSVGALVLLLAPPRWGTKWVRTFGVVVSGLTLSLAVPTAYAGGELDVSWVPALDLRFTLRTDGVSGPLVVLTAALVFLCLLYTRGVAPRAGRHRGLLGLVLLLEVGMLGTFLAGDLLLFFLFFETVLIPMWFLITVWGQDSAQRGETARTAATKFVLYTLLGSALMLVGFLVLHARTGTYDIATLTALSGAGLSHGTQLTAFGLIALGLAVKVPMWPLHTWLPGAHTAAPTIGSVLLAGVLLKMGTYGLVRVAVPLAPEGAQVFAPYLGAFGVVGILYGSLACLALVWTSPGSGQPSDLKRLIAYSSVGHMGFVLLGISTLTPVGINGALYANLAHGLITGLLFFLVGAIKDRHGTADLAVLPRSLYARLPHLGGLFAFAAVASLALPGLAGFWGEMLTMLAAYNPAPGLEPAFYRVLMALAGLGTVLTAAYLLLVVRRVCQGEKPEPTSADALRGDVTRHEWFVWSPLVAAVLVLGLWPGAILAFTEPVVATLVGGR